MNKTKFRYFQVQLFMQNLHLKLENKTTQGSIA